MAIDVLPWLEYRWSFDFPVGMYRPILERLRGTPDRVAAIVDGRTTAALTARGGSPWSAQEHLGHLIQVEQLWETRISEFLAGASHLTAADMTNRATEGADHNRAPVEEIVARFRAVRTGTLARLDPLTLDDAARVAHHPRLDRAMRLVDLCFFAAEHDDHHLAMSRALLAGEE
ncbi:MAG: DinB family protein [Acidobacteriota bacterium]